ncbi:universal stress protein [Salinibacter ruber]|uniref:universal stress protein n=1 Tax=Salinibacter ruber TaxID=146919 RepID=UPI003C6E1274
MVFGAGADEPGPGAGPVRCRGRGHARRGGAAVRRGRGGGHHAPRVYGRRAGHHQSGERGGVLRRRADSRPGGAVAPRPRAAARDPERAGDRPLRRRPLPGRHRPGDPPPHSRRRRNNRRLARGRAGARRGEDAERRHRSGPAGTQFRGRRQPADTIVEWAGEHDLVVLGETQPSVREFLFGTMPEQIVEAVNVPIIVVRHREEAAEMAERATQAD